MMRKTFSSTMLLLGAAFLLGLVLRLLSIGQTPLSDSEAILALQSLALSKGQATSLAAHPAYLTLTAGLMFLFGAGEWTARFWPALTGSLLIFTPIFFRRQIGHFPALILAFLIALDPGMISASITVGSPMIALFSIVMLAGMLSSGQTILAGVAAGFALLSGPGVWSGLLGIIAAILLTRLMKQSEVEYQTGLFKIPLPDWRKMILAAVATVFFAGTLFFIVPRGLSACAASFVDFLAGWTHSGSTSVALFLLGLVVYEFLVIFLGGWGSLFGLLRREPVDVFFAAWALISLAVSALYANRTMSDLIWSLFPLLALASRQVARMLDVNPYDRLPTLGQAVLSGLILGFLSLNILSMVNNPQTAMGQEYWIRLGGALVMLIASAGLIAWGWSLDISMRGLAWGFTCILCLYTISTIWNVTSLSAQDSPEFWSGKQTLPQKQLFINTIDQINQWSPAVSGGNNVVVMGISSPALEWALRDIKKLEFVDVISPESSPAYVISVEQPEIYLPASYRGQSFIIRVHTGWELFTAQEWLRWVGFRTSPVGTVQNERIVLWARTDLFPGDEAAAMQPIPSDDEPQ